MTDNSKLSDQPVDKLQASLSRDYADADCKLGLIYRQAVTEWYAALSRDDKAIAAQAAEAFERGDRAKAEQIAAELAPAPTFPLY